MAPVTATTAGVARQIIDDPALVELIRRLSEFDTAASTSSAGGAIAIASKGDAAAEDDKEDGDVVMADDNSPAKTAAAEPGSSQEGAPEEGGAPVPSLKPPLDIEGLVAELDKFPRWRFQEQVSFKS